MIHQARPPPHYPLVSSSSPGAACSIAQRCHQRSPKWAAHCAPPCNPHPGLTSGLPPSQAKKRRHVRLIHTHTYEYTYIYIYMCKSYICIYILLHIILLYYITLYYIIFCHIILFYIILYAILYCFT